MKYLKEYSFWKKDTEILTADAVKMVDQDLLVNLEDYFIGLPYVDKKDHYSEDDENYTMGQVGSDVWFCDPKTGELLGNIGGFENGKFRPWFYTNTKFNDGLVGYRVCIQLNDRLGKLPEDLYQSTLNAIKRAEQLENVKLLALCITNYNWEKYKSKNLYTKNFEDFKQYDGDIVAFALIFTKNQNG